MGDHATDGRIVGRALREPPRVKQPPKWSQPGTAPLCLRLFCWNIWLGADLDDGNPGIGQIAVDVLLRCQPIQRRRDTIVVVIAAVDQMQPTETFADGASRSLLTGSRQAARAAGLT